MKKRPRRSRGDADNPEYLAFVRTLPCCAPDCFGQFEIRNHDGTAWKLKIEAHHLTGAGMGRKARDDETMPLCTAHHRELHEFMGPFLEWTRDERQQWQLRQIEEVRALYLARSKKFGLTP